MRAARGLYVHFALLALAAVFAVVVWTREEKPKALAAADVTVWPGRPEDVERIVYEGKNRKAVLEAQKDEVGRWFAGTFEKETPPPKPLGDAGAPDAPAEPPKKTSTSFVAVGAAQKLAEALAPLRAFRNVGRIGDDRAAEFGLAEPEGTLTVVLRGTERKLVIGGPTPGGADRYVREAQSGEVFAIKGDVVRDLESADTRLTERDPHEWKDVDVAGAKVTAGDKSRELVRGGTESKRFWADPASPDQNDETAGNWMSKLDRLRPTEYATSAPEGASPVVRVEYRGTSGPLGFLELVKGPPGEKGKAEYFIRTERTRRHAKVTASLAEQVEQDVGSIVK